MQLAQALETSQSSITAWETEFRQPDFSTVAKIAAFFNVPMSALLPSSDGMDESYISAVAESLYTNQKLRLLFDAAKFLSPEDLDTVLSVANALNAKRGI